MEQHSDNRYKEILWDLLSNPADGGRLHKSTLEQLVQDHPQSGLLQVLFARAGGDAGIKRAATYFSPKAIHKLLHDPEGLPTIADTDIIKPNGAIQHQAVNHFSTTAFNEPAPTAFLSDEPVAAEESPAEITQQPGDIAAEAEAIEHKDELLLPGADHTQPVVGEIETVTVPDQTEETVAPWWEQEQSTDVAENTAVATEQETPDADAWSDTVITNEPIAEEHIPSETEQKPADPFEGFPAIDYPQTEAYHSPEPEATTDQNIETPQQQEVSSYTGFEEDKKSFEKEEYFRQDIDDEIYDEIVSIDDIGLESLNNKFFEEIINEDEYQPQTFESKPEPSQEETDPVTSFDAIKAEEDKLILGNIAATDYLAFDEKPGTLNGNAPVDTTEAEPAPAEAPQPEASTQDVSMYNDDKMPYSFMWWLNKTRKEHAGIYQPYASPVNNPAAYNADQTESAFQQPAKKNVADELQQQYYENIFSLTSVSSISTTDTPPVEFDHTKKEDVIIERFIHTDPQIKPLAADKLDNENKAKASSEDQDVMVTETLARIYQDQMLYHKAIATYKKLILKFPEKKLYFAAQIEQIEKKIN